MEENPFRIYYDSGLIGMAARHGAGLSQNSAFPEDGEALFFSPGLCTFNKMLFYKWSIIIIRYFSADDIIFTYEIMTK